MFLITENYFLERLKQVTAVKTILLKFLISYDL